MAIPLAKNSQTPVELLGIDLISEATSHIAQIFPYLRLPQVLNLGFRRAGTIVPGDSRSLLQQSGQWIASCLGVDCFGPCPDPISGWLTLSACRSTVRPYLACRHPNHQN